MTDVAPTISKFAPNNDSETNSSEFDAKIDLDFIPEASEGNETPNVFPRSRVVSVKDLP